jgi:aspartyl-tRNA(Asn)/glutamyl-tRNA(Gln) amidotransferase subunit C
MALDRDDVHHIALLARLQLSDEEEETFTRQLAHILEYFERLDAVAVDDVAPTAHVVDMAPAYRDDVVTNPAAPEELRNNAPARDGNFFKVPKIIE